MNTLFRHMKAILIVFPFIVVALLSGCGGKSSSGGPPPTAAVHINGTAATGDVTVCFAPESKAERTNYTALYSDNVGSSVCTITTGIGCFWCAR